MLRCKSLIALAILAAGNIAVWPQDKTPPEKKIPDGVYAVQRFSEKKSDVLPLKDGEELIVHNHRFLKEDDKTPPRYLAVRVKPDVLLDLAEAPKADKEDGEVVRISVKLKPKAAEALERLTRDRVGGEVAIVLEGEVVTMHRIREVIKGGLVQITSCAHGAAAYLLEKLEAHQK